MDVIASTAFGLQIDSHNDPNNQFVRMAKKLFDFNFFRLSTILLCKATNFLSSRCKQFYVLN